MGGKSSEHAKDYAINGLVSFPFYLLTRVKGNGSNIDPLEKNTCAWRGSQSSRGSEPHYRAKPTTTLDDEQVDSRHGVAGMRSFPWIGSSFGA